MTGRKVGITSKRAGDAINAPAPAHEGVIFMSKAKATPGIEVRQRASGTVYRAVVYEKRTDSKRSKTFATLAGAKQWRHDAISAIGAGRLATSRGPTLTEAAEQWLAGARSGAINNRSGDPYKPSAIRAYEADLRLRVLPDLGDRRVGDIHRVDLQQLVDRLVASGIAPSTVVGALLPLRAIYRRLHSRGVVEVNPTRGLEMPAVRRHVRYIQSPAEAEILLSAVDASDRPLWATALYAGLRRGELVALKWEDVDLASGVIHVRRGWDTIEGEIAPKSAQGKRNVPVPAALRDYLIEHRMDDGADGRVFASDRMVRSQAERSAALWKAAGLQPITLHEARHTYASFMIAAGVSAKALSTFMGHATIAVTLDLYGHLLPGSEAEAADLLDAFLARSAGATSPETSPDPTLAAAQSHVA
jgi:integrase